MPEKERIDRDLMKNGEGYPDYVPFKAIKHSEQEIMESRERHYKLIGLILRACEIAGFQVEERIVLRDTKTGRIFR